MKNVAALNVVGKPNEATVRIDPEGKMNILVRREEGDSEAWFCNKRMKTAFISLGKAAFLCFLAKPLFFDPGAGPFARLDSLFPSGGPVKRGGSRLRTSMGR